MINLKHEFFNNDEEHIKRIVDDYTERGVFEIIQTKGIKRIIRR